MTGAENVLIKCGTDLIRIERISQAIQRQGRPFLNRIWTVEEQADCRLTMQAGCESSEQADGVLSRLSAGSAASLAARFAAKEAVAKALGTGIGPLDVRWTDIVICRLSAADGQTESVRDILSDPDPVHPAMLRAPQVILKGGALERYQQLGGLSICVSLSHDGDLAMAYCVLLHEPAGADPEMRNRCGTSQEPMP